MDSRKSGTWATRTSSGATRPSTNNDSAGRPEHDGGSSEPPAVTNPNPSDLADLAGRAKCRSVNNEAALPFTGVASGSVGLGPQTENTVVNEISKET